MTYAACRDSDCAAAPRTVVRHACIRALIATGLAALLVLGAPAAASDRITVAGAELRLLNEGENGVVLNAQFDFELPAVLDEAVNRGIALYFVVEFELFRERWYWFDRRLAAESLTYRLTYSPLTRQYRLARGALAQPFESLGEALATLKRLRNWKVLDRGVLKSDEAYRAQVRMRLDTAQLPRPFQISALTQPDWTLASDWRNVGVTADLAR
jgi:hypothetical protein